MNFADKVLVSFDIATEVFTLIPHPSEISSWCMLTVYEKKLAILSWPMNANRKYFVIDLWVTEERAGTSGEDWGWTKKYSISRCPLIPEGIWLDEIVCREAGSEASLHLLNPGTLELQKFAPRRCG